MKIKLRVRRLTARRRVAARACCDAPRVLLRALQHLIDLGLRAGAEVDFSVRHVCRSRDVPLSFCPMAELLLNDLPARPAGEIKDGAKLRRATPEAATAELLRIGLHPVRARKQAPEDADNRVRH